MESNRVLLSDKHFHHVRLSEQQVGVICHGLAVLEVAFALEPQYLEIVKQARFVVATSLNDKPDTK